MDHNEPLLERIAATSSLPPAAERGRLRRALGIQQVEVARDLGVSPQSVWAWETGRSEPSGQHRRRYAELLNAMRERLAAEEGR